MTNRILLYASANENTISARMKSPQRFYVTYGELDRLRRDLVTFASTRPWTVARTSRRRKLRN